MSDPLNAEPVGFWQIPPDVWTDDEAMDDFAQRVFDQMTAVSAKGRDRTPGDQRPRHALPSGQGRTETVSSVLTAESVERLVRLPTA